MATVGDWAALVREAIADNDGPRYLELCEDLRGSNPEAAAELIAHAQVALVAGDA